MQKTIRLLLIYSLLYVSTSEIFVSDTLKIKNCNSEYFVSIAKNLIEINFNERSQRIRIQDQTRITIDKDAIVSIQCFSINLNFFVKHAIHPLHKFNQTNNSNHSLRAPPLT